jgi:hypothetical protein
MTLPIISPAKKPWFAFSRGRAFITGSPVPVHSAPPQKRCSEMNGPPSFPLLRTFANACDEQGNAAGHCHDPEHRLRLIWTSVRSTTTETMIGTTATRTAAIKDHKDRDGDRDHDRKDKNSTAVFTIV